MIRKIQKLFLRLIKELNVFLPPHPMHLWCHLKTECGFVSQIPPLFLKRGTRALRSDKEESCSVKPPLSRRQNLSGTKKTAGKFFLFFFLRCFLWARNSLKSILKTHKDCCGVRAFKSIWNKPDDVVSPDLAAALCTYWCFKWGFPFDEARWCFIGWFSVFLFPKCSF